MDLSECVTNKDPRPAAFYSYHALIFFWQVDFFHFTVGVDSLLEALTIHVVLVTSALTLAAKDGTNRPEHIGNGLGNSQFPHVRLSDQIGRDNALAKEQTSAGLLDSVVFLEISAARLVIRVPHVYGIVLDNLRDIAVCYQLL